MRRMETYVNTVLRPLLEGDGGGIEFVGFAGDVLDVRLRGECSFCAKAPLCLRWCEEKIKKDLGRDVTVRSVSVRPWFRDR